jgi:malate dehydrogenase (oxaloacetate-decarboxylating)(NADP+)
LYHSLLGKDRLGELSPEQAEFVRNTDGGMSLIDIVKKYKPTILLGMTAVGGLFTQGLIQEMASHCERPVIFPLSNPTTSAECTAEQAFEWTDGKCIFASGSPFDPVEMDDGRVFYPSQCNNSKYRCVDMDVGPVLALIYANHRVLLSQCTSFQESVLV